MLKQFSYEMPKRLLQTRSTGRIHKGSVGASRRALTRHRHIAEMKHLRDSRAYAYSTHERNSRIKETTSIIDVWIGIREKKTPFKIFRLRNYDTKNNQPVIIDKTPLQIVRPHYSISVISQTTTLSEGSNRNVITPNDDPVADFCTDNSGGGGIIKPPKKTGGGSNSNNNGGRPRKDPNSKANKEQIAVYNQVLISVLDTKAVLDDKQAALLGETLISRNSHINTLRAKIFNCSFNKALVCIMEWYGVSVRSLAEDSQMPEKTIQRMRRDPNYPTNIESVITVCVAMHLPYEISLDLLDKSGFSFRFAECPEHVLYKAFIEFFAPLRISVEDCNYIIAKTFDGSDHSTEDITVDGRASYIR